MPASPSPPLTRPDRPTRAPLALLLFLAGRGLVESKTSLAILLLAVAVGVGLHVPSQANLAGYDAQLLSQGVTDAFGDVRVMPAREGRFEEGSPIAARLTRHPEVEATVTVVTLPAAVGRGGRYEVSPVFGVDMKGRLPFLLSEGTLPGPGDRGAMVMGACLAKRLGVKRGDDIQLRVILASGDTPFPEENVGNYPMRILGLAVGAFSAHEAIFVDRAFLAGEIGEPDTASFVAVYARQHFDARELAARLAALLPGLEARAWMDDTPFVESALLANQKLGSVSQAMAMIAAAIPTLALFYIHVLHRRRQICLLGAIGLRQGELFLIYVLQAVLVGLVGVALGCGLGYLLVLYFQARPIFAADTEGLVIRPVLSWGCFIRPSLAVLAATMLAAVYPAWQAARTDAARILRGLE